MNPGTYSIGGLGAATLAVDLKILWSWPTMPTDDQFLALAATLIAVGGALHAAYIAWVGRSRAE